MRQTSIPRPSQIPSEIALEVVEQKSESLGWFKPNCQNAITYTKGSALRTMREVFNPGPFLRDAANGTDPSGLFVSKERGDPSTLTLASPTLA